MKKLLIVVLFVALYAVVSVLRSVGDVWVFNLYSLLAPVASFALVVLLINKFKEQVKPVVVM